MIRTPVSAALIGWVVAGALRVVSGSSTAPIAYAFFGAFWVLSLILLVVAVRQLVVSEKSEQKLESICICVGLVALFLEGLFGRGGATPVAAVAFLASMIVLLAIYARRLRRGRFIHP